MRRWLVLPLFLPAAQACSLAAPPVGPGVMEAQDWAGTVSYRIEVPQRGLGGDCSLLVPHAIDGQRVVWSQGGTLHELDLHTGQRRAWDIALDPDALLLDDEGILALTYQGAYPAVRITVHAVHENGTTVLRSHDGRLPSRYYDGDPWNVTSFDLRTGNVAFRAEPSDHPSHDRQEIRGMGTDGRYAVYSATGGRLVVWDNATQQWLDHEIDVWTWDRGLAGGHLVGSGDDRLVFVDLSTGTNTTRPADMRIMDVAPGWVLLGTYAEAYSKWPLGLPIPAPLAPLLGVMLLVRWRWAA